MSQENQQGSGNKLALPDVKTLTQAAKLSIKVSKPKINTTKAEDNIELVCSEIINVG